MTEYKAYKARVFIERPAADVEFEPVPDGAGCVICGRRFPIGAVPAARVAMALPELPIQSPVCRTCGFYSKSLRGRCSERADRSVGPSPVGPYEAAVRTRVLRKLQRDHYARRYANAMAPKNPQPTINDLIMCPLLRVHGSLARTAYLELSLPPMKGSPTPEESITCNL